MATQIQRPLYYEGQILGAADLTAAVDHGRGQRERHDRYLHSWGIAEGLTLSTEEAETADGAKFNKVILEPGVASDGAGREIVVSERRELDENLFLQINGADVDESEWYPVFLLSLHEEASGNAQLIGDCNSDQAARVSEGYEYTFGRLGDEQNLEEQDVPEPDEAPSQGTARGSWLILVGYVQWNSTLGRFSEVGEEANGVGRRYAGVVADEMAARGGKLTLQTQRQPVVGTPMMVMDEADGGTLCFGLYKGEGEVECLLNVNSKGDLEAVGKLIGSLTTGGVQVESGIANHGITLPLPPGVTQKQVDDGDAIVHTQVTPRVRVEDAPNSDPWLALVRECYVDERRRVRCQIAWADPAVGLPGSLEWRTGVVDYSVMVTVRSQGESSA